MLSDADKDRFSPLCPDFIIELRSQSDRRAPLEEKMEQWIANGVQLAWLIDPIEQAITIYRPNCPPETLQEPTCVVGGDPVLGLTLVTERLWF